MSKHIIDTKIKVSTCNRCSDLVFACQVSGLKVMADPKPIMSLDDMREALLAGKETYRILYVSDTPWKLQRITSRIQWIKYLGGIVADHSCGMATANNSRPVEAVPLGPHRPSATSGGRPGGNHPGAAPAGPQTATQRSCPAEPAIHHRSEYINRVCPRCREMIGENWNVIGVKLGDRWMWVQHADCQLLRRR